MALAGDENATRLVQEEPEFFRPLLLAAQEQQIVGEAEQQHEQFEGVFAQQRGEFEKAYYPLTDSEAEDLADRMADSGDPNTTIEEVHQRQSPQGGPNMRDRHERTGQAAEIIEEEMRAAGEWDEQAENAKRNRSGE